MTKSKDKSNPTAPKKKPNLYPTMHRIRLNINNNINNNISNNINKNLNNNRKPKTTYVCSLCRMSFSKKYNSERHLASCRSRLSTEGREVIVIRG